MSAFHNDRAITGKTDSPDLLNRTSFAHKVANILVIDPAEDCLTVSLEGIWGGGKTSTINLIKDKIKQSSPESVVIEYNPWMSGNSGALIQDFLIQLSSTLSIVDNSYEASKASKQLLSYSSLFSVAKLIPGAEPWASVVEKVTSSVGKATHDVSKLKELSLIDKKSKVQDAIRGMHKSIVVIIDDIDRLTPAETFEVLRLVKAVADFQGTTFLLAFDANYLTSVLARNNISNANEYVDKIVQLRIPLPIVSERGMAVLADRELTRLSDTVLTASFESDQERLSWIYHNHFKKLVKTPRELKRFFNHLRFTVSQIQGQVAFSDLFGLSLIAIKANRLYEHIKSTPEAYIGKSLLVEGLELISAEDNVKLYEDDRANILSDFDKKSQVIIIDLLRYLFPLLDENSLISTKWKREDDAVGRISVPQRLYTALHYDTPLGFISDGDILNFIKGEVERREFVESVFSNDLINRFFELVRNYIGEFGENSFEILVPIYDLALNSELMKIGQESNYGFLRIDLYRELRWLTEQALEHEEDQKTLVRKLVTRTENVVISAFIIDLVRIKINDEITRDRFWGDSEFLEEISSKYIQVAIEALRQKLFFPVHLELNIFSTLYRCSVADAKKFIDELLVNERGLVRFAEIVAYNGRDSSNGPYAKIDENSFEGAIELERLKSLVESVEIEEYPMPVQAVFKSILDGEEYYVRDALIKEF